MGEVVILNRVRKGHLRKYLGGFMEHAKEKNLRVKQPRQTGQQTERHSTGQVPGLSCQKQHGS